MKKIGFIVGVTFASVFASAAANAEPDVYGAQIGMTVDQSTSAIMQYAASKNNVCKLSGRASYKVNGSLAEQDFSCSAKDGSDAFSITATYSSKTSKAIAIRLLESVDSNKPISVNALKSGLEKKYDAPAISRGYKFGGWWGRSYVWLYDEGFNKVDKSSLSKMCLSIGSDNQRSIDDYQIDDMFFYRSAPNWNQFKPMSCGVMLFASLGTEVYKTATDESPVQEYNLLLVDSAGAVENTDYIQNVTLDKKKKAEEEAQKKADAGQGNF